MRSAYVPGCTTQAAAAVLQAAKLDGWSVIFTRRL
jgi:hypothetical protein